MVVTTRHVNTRRGVSFEVGDRTGTVTGRMVEAPATRGRGRGGGRGGVAAGRGGRGGRGRGTARVSRVRVTGTGGGGDPTLPPIVEEEPTAPEDIELDLATLEEEPVPPEESVQFVPMEVAPVETAVVQVTAQPLHGLDDDRMDLVYSLGVCGFNNAQIRIMLYKEACTGLMELADFDEARVKAIGVAAERSTINRVEWSTKITFNLGILVFWAQDTVLRHCYFPEGGWTENMMEHSKKHKKLMDKRRGPENDPTKNNPSPPPIFSEKKWSDGIKRFDTYLSQCYEHGWAPLDYVTRGVITGDTERPEHATYEQKLKWDMPHFGSAYKMDNQSVYSKLKEWTTGTVGSSYILKHQKTEDGRAAYISLHSHYEGAGLISLRCKAALRKIKTLTYDNEHHLSFERYSQQMTDAFLELEAPNNPVAPYTEVQKLAALQDGMQGCTHPRIMGFIWNLDNFTEYDKAVTFTATQIAKIYSIGGSETKNLTKKRWVSSAQSGKRSGGGGGGKGGGNLPSPNNGMLHGVDVKDVFRQFSKSDWEKLRKNRGDQYIFAQRLKLKKNGHGGRGGGGSDSNSGGGGGRNISGVSTDDAEGEEPDLEEPESNKKRGGKHGLNFGPGKHARFSALKSSMRQVGGVSLGAVDTDQFRSPPGTMARNELDSHADTSCAGANWTPLAFTGEVCTVSPYSNEYAPKHGVPVATCATAIVDGLGVTTILAMHQMLFFGTQLPNSLLNPNQVRLGGITIHDDPTGQQFGMDLETGFVEFESKGTNIFFTTRVPTKQELRDCDIIFLNEDLPWDPATVSLRGNRTPEEEELRWLKSVSVHDLARVTVGGVSTMTCPPRSRSFNRY